MAKKKNPGGQSDLKRRGMKVVVVPLTQEQHERFQLAAGTYTGTDRAVSRWLATVGDAAAVARLAELGIESLKKDSEEIAK